MLVNAKFLEDQINALLQSVCFKEDYMYYFEQWRPARTINTTDEKDQVILASVRPLESGYEVLGFFSTYRDPLIMSAALNGAVSFDKGRNNITFGRDLIKWIHYMFTRCNIQKFVCHAVADNPAAKTYERLVKSVGGRQSAYYNREVLLKDGNLHDFMSFEILRENYLENCTKVISKYIRDEAEKGDIIKSPYISKYVKTEMITW